MKAMEAITRANALRPNVIPESQMAGWLAELDGKLAELLRVEPKESPYPEDWELLMPFPVDNIYELYLCARIDNAQQETEDYENDMVIFNAALDEAKAWWIRHNPPRRTRGWITI